MWGVFLFINLFSIHNSRILQEKVRDQERENDSLYKKVGQLTTQVDWLKKKSEEILGPDWESRFTPRPKSNSTISYPSSEYRTPRPTYPRN